MVSIVITQSIKGFLEERNSRCIFLEEEKKIIQIFFFILNFLANIKMSADLAQNFFENDS